MSLKTIRVNYNRKSVGIPVRKVGFLRKGIGLMFRSKRTDNLLFEFGRETRTPFTSLFVFFPYLSLWLDEGNRVIDARIVKPFVPRVVIDKPFYRVVEVPVNERNSEILSFFRREGAKV